MSLAQTIIEYSFKKNGYGVFKYKLEIQEAFIFK